MAEAENTIWEVRRRSWNWISQILKKKKETNECAAALVWTPEGRRKRDRPKQHCDRWWRLNGTMPGGAPRTRHAVQPQTDINGKTMSKPYVPMLLTGFFFMTVK